MALPLATPQNSTARALEGPRFSFYPRDLALLILIVVGISLPFWRPTSPDFFWHEKAGELVLRELAPPRVDEFSFTSQGKQWLDHEWLTQGLLYGVYSAAGYAGCVLLFGAFGLVSVLCGFWLMRRLEVPDIPALALLALAIVLGFQFWIVRPAPLSALMLALVYCSTYMYARGRAQTLWHLAPLMAVWANLHGAYVIGLVLIGLLALDQLIREGPRGRRFRHVALAGVLAFMATGLNPYTYRLWLYPFTYFGGENHSLAIVSEWQSPAFFHSVTTIPIGLVLLALVFLGATGKRADPWRVGVALLFTFFALQSGRHQLFFAVVIPPLLGELLVERWPGLLSLGRPRLPLGLTVANLAVGGLFIALALQLVTTRGLQAGSTPWLTAPILPFPAAGAEFLRNEYPRARVFNEYAWGGYLIYENWPAQQVFIDGRADLHGGLLREYERVWSLNPGWEQVLEKYQIDAVIFGKSSRLAVLLRKDSGWREAFTGRFESVFVRIDERGEESQEK